MSGEKNWYLLVNGENDGPHSVEDIIRLIQNREVGPQTQAYGPEADGWRPLSEIPVFVQASAPRSAPAAPPGIAGAVAPITGVGGPVAVQAASAALASDEPKRASTLHLRFDRASEYSKVNFVLRLFGVYYVLYAAHFFLWAGYSFAASVIFGLDMILAIIGGKHHPGLVKYLQRFMNFSVQMSASAMGMTEEIPHIDINSGRDDFPVSVEVTPQMDIGRGDVILRLSGIIFILLFPHLIALYLLSIGAGLAFVIGFFAVIFTGSWPEVIWNFLVGVIRWQLRVGEYMYGFSTTYPSFGLK
jgi:hypothetical protein